MRAPFFHVGILVADLSIAIENFSRVFEVEFNEPAMIRTPLLSNDDRRNYDMRVSYSRNGPPFLELIEGHDVGYFSLAGGEGVHHIGLWVGDGEVLSDSNRFRALHIEAAIPHEDTTGTVTRMSSPSMLHGVRLEMVEEGDRVGLEAWIGGTAGQPRLG